MENCVYELERYEACDEDGYFLGMFSTIEKAKEYAEKDISTIKRKYRIDKDWGEGGLSDYTKRLIIEDEDKPEYFCDDEYDIYYTISKRELDPEFKED